MPGVVVTGGAGFLGRHVLGELVRSGPGVDDILAVGRRCPPDWPRSSFAPLDLLNEADRFGALVRSRRPEILIHLAGRTPPAPPIELQDQNPRLLDAAASAASGLGGACLLVVAGSAAEYGAVAPDRLPIREDEPCRPIDAYGLGKWQATQRALGHARRTGLPVRIGRIFNLIGPGLPVSQAFGRFAALLAGSAGSRVRLTVGSLEARRDFIDVRDAARALVLLSRRGGSGDVYNIAIGESRSISEGLRRLIQLSGRDVELAIDPEQAARPGVADSRGDSTRLRVETGWSPAFSFDRSLSDLWDEARSPAAAGARHVTRAGFGFRDRGVRA
jgi:GDP-4-dehydro-6-deoxy-D-mannose reductase